MRLPRPSLRRMERAAAAEAARVFASRSADTVPPYDHNPPRPRRLRWGQRAKMELEAVMELDLDPDRERRRKHPPASERVAAHLKERGFD